ncbi:hypothetical protein KSD_70530 [Ktedonobacter sp. SOSP1-85]|nr:hypothetical protein KSD_70530 [Ktedonobacter sp. SOSP1-85]
MLKAALSRFALMPRLADCSCIFAFPDDHVPYSPSGETDAARGRSLCLGEGKGLFDLLVKRALILLQRQGIVAFLIDGLRRNLRLCAYYIDGDYASDYESIV